MALTLAVDIAGASDNPIVLSASPGASLFSIDSEQMTVLGAIPPARMTVPADGSGGSGRQVDLSNVSVSVQRGANGTQPCPHSAGATVSPLFPVYSATPGTTV
jgi:hypothetical protein